MRTFVRAIDATQNSKRFGFGAPSAGHHSMMQGEGPLTGILIELRNDVSEIGNRWQRALLWAKFLQIIVQR